MLRRGVERGQRLAQALSYARTRGTQPFRGTAGVLGTLG